MPSWISVEETLIINAEKATAIIQHITYNVLDEHYDTDIFTEPTIKGKLGTNAMKAQRHLYDHIVYDSTNERDFAAEGMTISKSTNSSLDRIASGQTSYQQVLIDLRAKYEKRG